MQDSKPGDKLMCPYFSPMLFQRNRRRLLISHFSKRREVS